MATKKKPVDPRVANRAARMGPVSRKDVAKIRDQVKAALDLIDVCDAQMEKRGYEKIDVDGWTKGKRGADLLMLFTANLQRSILISPK